MLISDPLAVMQWGWPFGLKEVKGRGKRRKRRRKGNPRDTIWGDTLWSDPCHPAVPSVNNT